jgi:hypothetical protein
MNPSFVRGALIGAVVGIFSYKNMIKDKSGRPNGLMKQQYQVITRKWLKR